MEEAGKPNEPASKKTSPWARIMTDEEYYPFLVKTPLRPALWRWRDVEAVLKGMSDNPNKNADRRFIGLVHDDLGDSGACAPTLYFGMQWINPGEHVKAHRHNTFAIYHMMQGTGYSIVEGVRIDWEKGDTFMCPAWSLHEHFNTGTEPAIMIGVQDFPARAGERNLMFEEVPGRPFHVVKGAAPQSE
ncbi:MAG: cupin domain-containing protein [Alphaproteobacteria bacterium]|nr:cupin domain-containing protein [Alphaproteobacteria bacterium]